MSKKDRISLMGRTRCVFVFHEKGMVSEIVARVLPNNEKDRILFKGPVRVKESIQHHMASVVIPLVDRIADILNTPRKNYEISIINPGATSISGIGVEVAGFSLDLPMLMSLLSISFGIPIKQEVISTGHVGSIDGDLVCVQGIPAKIEAAADSHDITDFVMPDPEKEGSLKIFTPAAFQATMNSLSKHMLDMNIHRIRDIGEGLKIFFADEAVIMGSLKSGYFYHKVSDYDFKNPFSSILRFLTSDLKRKFWSALEYNFLNCDLQRMQSFLLAYVEFHIKKGLYPDKFGEDLLRLISSLPPGVRKNENLFPLFSFELIIKLSGYAAKKDYDDVPKLYRSVLGDGLRDIMHSSYQSDSIIFPQKDTEENIVEWILNEISLEKLTSQIGQPLDRARASYRMDSITVKNGFEFNEEISAFYHHLYRHADYAVKHPPLDAVSAEAVDLVKRAFTRLGGYNAALAEGKNGINGGMRRVFDEMTEYLKIENMEKHINKIFKESIDPLDWDAKVRLTRALMEFIGDTIPTDLKELPPEQLANKLEPILQAYTESLGKFRDFLRKL